MTGDGGKPYVVVAMPAYRAERTLGKTVAALPAGAADALLLVDDASPDATVAVARELGLHVLVHPTNLGYGGNQKSCYDEALRMGADIVVLLHPDYQYDPTAVPALVEPIVAGRADFTFGSRFARGGNPRIGGMPRYRYIGNRLTTAVLNRLLGTHFTEMHSGFKAYSRQFLESVPYHDYSDDFVFDTQILFDSIGRGFAVEEVPIPTRYTEESSSISIRRSLQYIAESIYNALKVRLLPAVSPGHLACPICGSRRTRLRYAANVGPADAIAPDEFACTSSHLNRHTDIWRCRRCGICFADAPATEPEIVEQYQASEDPRYLVELEQRRRLFREQLRELESYEPGRRLMEIGSNIGLFLSEAEQRGWQARGIEPSRWAVEYGRRAFGVDLTQGTLESSDIGSERYDAVVTWDVLEHLVDPVRVLRDARRSLKPGGTLMLTTVNIGGPGARLLRGRWPWLMRMHLFYFTHRSLALVLRRAGYRVERLHTQPRTFHLAYLLDRVARYARFARVPRAIVERLGLGRLPVTINTGDILVAVARNLDTAFDARH